MTISQDITKEIMFLFHSFLLGIVITFVYDGFLVLRKLFKHTMLLISLEDMIFWIACALSVFCVLYEENNGMLRWFAVAGATLGMLVYKKTLSRPLVNGVSAVFSFLFRIMGKVWKIIMKPFGFLAGKARKGGRYAGKKTVILVKHIKKKLTEFKKTLKIILSKQ